MIVELVVPRDVYNVLGGQADRCEGRFFSPLQLVAKPFKQIPRLQVVQFVLVHPFSDLVVNIEETIGQKLVVTPACQSLSHYIQLYVLHGKHRELILLFLWEVPKELKGITHLVIGAPILFVIDFPIIFVISVPILFVIRVPIIFVISAPIFFVISAPILFVISVPIFFVICVKTLFVIIALKFEFKADCLYKLSIFDLF